MTLKVIHLEIATKKKSGCLSLDSLLNQKEKNTKDGCNGQSSSGKAKAAGMTCSYSAWRGTGCRSSCRRQLPRNVSTVVALVRTAAPYVTIHQYEKTLTLKELLEVFTSFYLVWAETAPSGNSSTDNFRAAGLVSSSNRETAVSGRGRTILDFSITLAQSVVILEAFVTLGNVPASCETLAAPIPTRMQNNVKEIVMFPLLELAV